jgi:protein TorT
MKLVEDGLQTYPDVRYIVGMASATEGAQQIMKEMVRSDIKLASYYMTIGIWKGVAR